jgi:hypothetical protein
MNAHNLMQLIVRIDDIDFEDLEAEDFKQELRKLSPDLFEDIGDALRELQARRKAVGDEHGVEVPS